MSRGALNFEEEAVEYYTPKKILDYFGPFEYDPATTPTRAAYHGIPKFDTAQTDGLKRDWAQFRRIWINPPFNAKQHFWWKACETYQRAHNDILFLCPTNFLTTARLHRLSQPFTLYLPQTRIKFEEESAGGGVAKSPAFGSVILRPSEHSSLIILPREVTE